MSTDHGVRLSDGEALLAQRLAEAEAIIAALWRRDAIPAAGDAGGLLREADALQAAYDGQYGTALAGVPDSSFCRRCYARIVRRGEGLWRHDEAGKDHPARPADPEALAVP